MGMSWPRSPDGTKRLASPYRLAKRWLMHGSLESFLASARLIIHVNRSLEMQSRAQDRD